jgi:hypothetical protein
MHAKWGTAVRCPHLSPPIRSSAARSPGRSATASRGRTGRCRVHEVCRPVGARGPIALLGDSKLGVPTEIADARLLDLLSAPAASSCETNLTSLVLGSEVLVHGARKLPLTDHHSGRDRTVSLIVTDWQVLPSDA